MTLQELTTLLQLEAKHFEIIDQEAPLVDPGVYNTLGKELFHLYQKYEIPTEDQRKLEALCYVLTSKNLDVSRKPGFLSAFKKRLGF